jgi:transposase InsO family protein
LFDRKVVDRAFSDDMRTEHTTVPALAMACMNRRPGEGLLFHSDRGVQYCAASFRDRLQTLCPAVRQNMIRKGNCSGLRMRGKFFQNA